MYLLLASFFEGPSFSNILSRPDDSCSLCFNRGSYLLLRFFDSSLAESALHVFSIPVYRKPIFYNFPILLWKWPICALALLVYSRFRTRKLLRLFSSFYDGHENSARIEHIAFFDFRKFTTDYRRRRFNLFYRARNLGVLFRRFSSTITFLLALTVLICLSNTHTMGLAFGAKSFSRSINRMIVTMN